MAVVLDTGSSDLWFTATGCIDCTAGTPLFDPSASSTFQAGVQQIHLNYGLGSADGNLGADTVSVGPFTVNLQSFGA
jgi:cathepsin D